MSVVEEIGRSNYVSLTTYRRNGVAVATPVWLVREDDELLLVSEADAGKVKRIRANSQVVVTVCDVRGRIKPGAPTASGTARLLDEKDTQTARALVARKYLLSRIGNWASRTLHLRKKPVIAIAVSL